MEGFSGAEIKSVATEAGYFAIRRMQEGDLAAELTQIQSKIKKYEDLPTFKKIIAHVTGNSKSKLTKKEEDAAKKISLLENKKNTITQKLKDKTIIQNQDFVDAVDKIRNSQEFIEKHDSVMFG